MLQAQASERELIDQFLAALRSLPEVRAELERAAAPNHDAQLALDVAGKPIHALVEVRKAVYPRDVRELVWRIRDLARQQPAGESGGEALAVLIAESISPGAKELLRAERVGYYDSGGSLYLPARGAYLYVEQAAAQVVVPVDAVAVHGAARAGNARPADPPPGLARREGPGRADVGLACDGVPGAVRDGAPRLAGVARAGAQQAEAPSGARGAARCLGEAAELDPAPGAATLLRARDEDRRPDGAPRSGLRGARRRLRRQLRGGRAALRAVPVGGLAGSMPTAGGVGGRCRDRATWAHASSARARISPSSKRSRPGDLLFRERVGGVWLASPIQVYLDLLRGEGRAKEMAEHLRRERIGF